MQVMSNVNVCTQKIPRQKNFTIVRYLFDLEIE